MYVYVFGGHIPHLHVHLAPQTEGDALNTAMLKGEIVEQPLPSGAVALVSKDYPAHRPGRVALGRQPRSATAQSSS